jgi:hypothetical protein
MFNTTERTLSSQTSTFLYYTFKCDSRKKLKRMTPVIPIKKTLTPSKSEQKDLWILSGMY